MNINLTKIKSIMLADDDADDCSFFEDALKEVRFATELTIAKDGAALMTSLEENLSEPPPPPCYFSRPQHAA